MSEKKGGCLKDTLVAGVGLLCAGYILNPTAGADIIPDFMPVVGNLDEATAVVMLLACLRHFGVNLDFLLGAARNRKDEEKEVNARVVDEDEPS